VKIADTDCSENQNSVLDVEMQFLKQNLLEKPLSKKPVATRFLKAISSVRIVEAQFLQRKLHRLIHAKAAVQQFQAVISSVQVVEST